MNRWRRGLQALWVLALAAFGKVAEACPVCFGETDAPIVQGIEASVLFMIGVTYCLILGGVAMFFLLRRRALRLQREQAETA